MYNIVKYRKIFSRQRTIAMTFIPVVTVCGSLIQLFYPTILLEMFSTSLATLICVILYFNKNDSHSNTGIADFQSFINSLKLSLFSNEERTHIMYKIDGYEAIKSMLSFDEMFEICDDISDAIMKISRKKLIFSSSFYLGKGLFVVSFVETPRNNIIEFIKSVDENIEKLKFGRGEANINLKHIILKTPKDIDSPGAFINLIQYLNYNEGRIGSSMYSENILESEDFIIESKLHKILNDAMQDDKIEVFYQPIYSTKDKCFKSAEALLRLNNEKYGYISPQSIINAAENSGRISELGLIIYEKVCAFMDTEEFKKLNLKCIEINLSFNQLLDPLLPKSIIEITTKHHILPKQINFEITESRTAYNLGVINKNINELVNMGFSLSLDDYGTGYSNIKRITEIPLSKVKIDKSLVDLLNDNRIRYILSDTINLFHSIGFEIVVEGVEDEKSLEFFNDLGCEYIQGYYYSKPLEKEEFISFLTSKTQ